jgi:hypothetical protein
MTDSQELSEFELNSLDSIAGYQWVDVAPAFWESHSDVVSWLSPTAFCYYLPSILLASIEQDWPNLSAVHSLMFMLDRTPDREFWDSHFEARWSLLKRAELAAVQAWLEWLSDQPEAAFDETSLIRAALTLDLLAKTSA